MNITYQKSSKHVVQTFETVKRALDKWKLLKLPGGIVLTGGASSLAGVQEVSTRNLRGTSENLYFQDKWE